MRLLNSVVVSAMVSETKVFTCYEFPEWMRVFWLLWALTPTAVSSVSRAVKSVRDDFTAGLAVICGFFLPVVMATG